MRAPIALLTSVLVASSVLVGIALASPGTTAPASAATLSGAAFDAGNIISDANFYDGTAMAAADVQTFLDTQVAACGNANCLRSGSFSLDSHPADAMCSAVTGGTGLSAATVITRVGAACGINPKVILTTLQKEQSLVTTASPSAGAITSAMGYACPDTGSGCDPAYAGLGNQVYRAAWQWKRYGNPSGTSAYFTWLAPGSAHVIQYSPAVSCGTRTVTIQNAATAALYYYTPYTPDQAALDNLYGTGDACSSYGNRNFWRIYSDWFGSPTGTVPPIGSVDGMTAGAEAVTVNGWALDPTTSASTTVRVTVGGTSTTVTANGNRPDVAAAYPGSGAAHGYTATVAAPAGPQSVCVSALTVAGTTSTSLGCRTLTVAQASPYGSVDTAAAGPGGLAVNGWVIDPDQQTAPVTVRVTVDGKDTLLTANGTRADIGRAYPAAGSAHGFSSVLAVSAGTHTVCITAVNTGAGADTTMLSCRTIWVPGSTPVGSLDAVTASGNTVVIGGWALDGDTTAPIPADVYIDGVGRRTTANASRPDIARSFPAYGDLHGIAQTIPVADGTHTVCVYAINAGTGSDNTLLGCRTVTVGAPPIGSLDGATGVPGGVTVNGWAWDPDSSAATSVDVYVDAVGRRIATSTPRPDVQAAHPSAGPSRGFGATLPASRGGHQVCAYGIDANGGANTLLGCRTVTVP